MTAGLTWGDGWRGTLNNYLYALAGPSVALGSHLRLAGGVGYALNRPLRRWHDPTNILGTKGLYITDGFSDDETHGLAFGGAVQVRGAGGTTLHLGFVSPMNVAQVGIGYTF